MIRLCYGTLFAFGGLLVIAPNCAFAQQLKAPTSYDMPNGETGSFHFWDDTYTGAGSKTTNDAPLTGGLGDLTDGVIATDNWNVTNGPYVGWFSIDPTITFHFDTSTQFQSARIYFDNLSPVPAPRGVVINGTNYSVTTPGASGPFFVDFDLSTLAATNQLAIQLFRQTNNGSTWVMASEFKFTTLGPASTPEPGSIALLITGGLTGLGLMRRRCTKSISRTHKEACSGAEE